MTSWSEKQILWDESTSIEIIGDKWQLFKWLFKLLNWYFGSHGGGNTNRCHLFPVPSHGESSNDSCQGTQNKHLIHLIRSMKRWTRSWLLTIASILCPSLNTHFFTLQTFLNICSKTCWWVWNGMKFKY